MEMAVKLAVYLTLGIGLLACNLWFFSSAYRAVVGGDLVVAPVKVIGGSGNAEVAGETLAGMIVSSLQKLEWDLGESQKAFRQQDTPANEDVRYKGEVPSGVRPGAGIATGVLGTPKTAMLNAQIFEPTNIDVKVAGVDVGGLLPRIQRWFVADRILGFSVSWNGKDAIIAGNIDALGVDKAKPIWLVLHNATADSVAEAIALALVQRQWAKESPQFGELRDDEFGQLVHSINDVAQINRRVVTYNAPATEEFANILPSVDPLADRVRGWSELTYFVASIAEGAGRYDRALELYRRLRSASKPPLALDVLAAKIVALESQTKTVTGETKAAALAKMRGYAADTARILNRLFDSQLPDPEVELAADDYLNAYWDGHKILAPSVVQAMPDIVYHEAAWPFVQSKWHSFKYQGQTGALVQSYTDILAALVKQMLLKQDAKTADWVIAPGAIAWLRGKPNEIASDRRPLRSLKAPGTAYDDEIFGKDTQIANFGDLPKAPLDYDNGGVHVLSGIPSRAFYETAVRIGSKEAGRIWIASLGQFSETVDLSKAADLIYKKAVALYGASSDEAKAVKAGWNTVGLLL
jgi:Thermolysin metallopeptidase, alpha-helical domain